MVQKEEGMRCGCGVGERLRDYWTPVYFADIVPWYPFFIVSCPSFSHPGFTLLLSSSSSVPLFLSRPSEAIKALSAGTFKAAVATSVDLLICEPTTTYPETGAFRGRASGERPIKERGGPDNFMVFE